MQILGELNLWGTCGGGANNAKPLPIELNLGSRGALLALSYKDDLE